MEECATLDWALIKASEYAKKRVTDTIVIQENRVRAFADFLTGRIHWAVPCETCDGTITSLICDCCGLGAYKGQA